VAGSPRAVEGLRSVAAGRKLDLVWKASATKDVVYLVTVDGGRRVGATGSPSFGVVGLKPGERRCFQVSVQDTKGRDSPRSEEICVAGPGDGAKAAADGSGAR
jgi:hypothetical protein